jgi:hypothetical protein
MQMKPAAIGVRVHSGWSVLVAVSIAADLPEIVERQRIVIIDPARPGAKQPYHFAERLSMQAAEKHISDCAADSQRLARTTVDGTLHDLRRRGYKVTGCALLLASGRALPSLPDILASHALIHTAEGEFFRDLFRNSFEQLRVRVTGVRERDLEDRAGTAFGDDAPQVVRRISELGRVAGPPWTTDEKSAALAAWMLLTGKLS